MAFHRSNLGWFNPSHLADMEGYIPEEHDDPWDFAVDHGTETTHHKNGELTEYGKWWEEEGFPLWVARCVKATQESENNVHDWQDNN